MLHVNNPIDELIALPDTQLQASLKKWRLDVPWVCEYVEYILAGNGNHPGDYYINGEEVSGKTTPSFSSNRHFVGRGWFHGKFH